MQLKTISILTDGIYPFVMGGMQKHSFYLAKYFAKRGVIVDLYHYLPNDKNIDNVRFTESESKFINHIIIPMPAPDRFIGHYIRQCKAYSKNIALQIKTRTKTDFIYAQGFTAWALLNSCDTEKKMPPIAVNFHGLEPLQKVADFKSGLQKYMLLPFLMHNLRKANYVFSLGGNLTKLLENAGINSKKIIEIPIGIEPDWLVNNIAEKNSKIRFLFIGRNERRKGIIELSAALKKIASDKAEFHFIGPISLNDIGINNMDISNIIFHGAIYEQEKIKEITRSCDVLVCASYSEGMPTVILEAMSSGLAVIATNVGATNELVNDNTGWLIDAPTPHQIETALHLAINCDDAAFKIKRSNAQQLIANKFLWDEVIEKTIKSIENILVK